MGELQTAAMTYRKTIWIAEANQLNVTSEAPGRCAPIMAQPMGVQDSHEGDDIDTANLRSTIGKRRSDEQGVRDPVRDRDALPSRVASLPPQSTIFKKGAEELSSSVPSSAGETTPSIPATFQGSAAALPTDTRFKKYH